MRSSSRKIAWGLIFVLLFLGGIVGGFLYFSRNFGAEKMKAPVAQEERRDEDFSFVRVYYPSEGRLIMEERRIRRQVSIAPLAEEIVEEFLRGPSNAGKSLVPSGTKLLSAYYGTDGIVYVDLSEEFRRNFQGDALAEYLLLKGLYDSIISNVTGVDDVKIIVEGKEIESIGGHFFAQYPLKNTVAEVR